MVISWILQVRRLRTQEPEAVVSPKSQDDHLTHTHNMSFLHRLRRGYRDSSDLPRPHPTTTKLFKSDPPATSPSSSSPARSSSSPIPTPNNQKRQHKPTDQHEEKNELDQHDHVANTPAGHKAFLLRTKEFEKLQAFSSGQCSKFHNTVADFRLRTQRRTRRNSYGRSSSSQDSLKSDPEEELNSMKRQHSHDSEEESVVGRVLPDRRARRLARVNTLSEAHAILQRNNTYAIKAVLRRPRLSDVDGDCTRPASPLETSDADVEVDVSLLRLDLKPQPRYAELLQEISRVYGTEAVMKIKYLDNDGDEINIVNDDSLCYAVNDWKRRTRKRCRLAPSLRIYLEEVAPDRQAVFVSSVSPL